MRKVFTRLFFVGLATLVGGQELAPAADQGLAWDVGGDLRVRQEISDNLPVRGGATAVNANYLRIRPRIWGEVKNEDFKLYLRLTDGFRHYFNPRESRNYRAPDEVLVDNLYLDFYNLLDGVLDVRIGRQDLMYGAGRVIMDGTPFDGSRTLFFDAVKATVKFDERNTLDLLALYNMPETELSWGHPRRADGSEYKERPLNSINLRSKDLTEYGGGLYFKSKEVKEVPFELYYIYKRETKARMAGGVRLPGRKTHTLGTRLMPHLTETIAAELEGAAQVGEKDGGPAVAGYMGYAGLTYRPQFEMAKPFFTGAFYYLSGDRHREDPGNNDTAWNPLWSRWPQHSEMYVYNFIYGVGYWSNLIYPHVESGVTLPNGHKARVSLGPMYAAIEDDLGGGEGDLYGWLGVVRYDFPLLKNIFGKRGDLTGHVTAEVLDPGDYYTSDTWAYFLRWEVIAKF